MCGKFVALLFVLSCAAQGYPAASAPAFPFAETRITVDEIVKTLNELIAKIRQTLGGIGDLIVDLEQKIKDVISTINIPRILADIKKNIEDIIKAAGIDMSAAKSCLEKEATDVEQLVSSTTDGVNKCLQGIDPVKNQIMGHIAEINSEASGIISDITSSIAKCFKDHALNPVKLLDCLKGLVAPTTEKVTALLDKINDEVKQDQELIGKAATDLSNCVKEVAADAQKQESAIIDKFQQCVNDIVN